MTTIATHASERPARHWGIAAAWATALLYTLANICLRRVVDCDPVFVSCLKAVPTVFLVAPALVWLVLKGRPVIGSWQTVGVVVIGAALAQLLGNCIFQWSLGIVGLALAVPVTLGAVLIGSAILGGRLLGESVTVRSWVSIGVLIFAIVVLSLGAEAAYDSLHAAAPHAAPALATMAAGVAGFFVAGLAYSSLGAVIGHASARGMPLPSILMVAGLVGVVGLGTIVWWRDGLQIFQTTSAAQMVNCLIAGLFNGLAFCSLAFAIHSIGLLNVNALNASQAGLAGIAGVALFAEPMTMPLVIGIGLTILGLLLMPPAGPNTSIRPNTFSREP